MLNNNYFQYYPIKSPIHNLNSTAKIIIFILSFISLFMYQKMFLVVLLAITGIQLLLSNVPIKYYFKIIYIFRYLFIIIVLICAALNIELTTLLLLIIKIIVLIEMIMLITYTTSPIEIANGIENILKPFNILFIKTGKLTLKIMLTIKSIPIMLATTDKVINSQASRGFDYYYKTIIGKIIIMLKSFPSIINITKIQVGLVKQNMLLKIYNGDKIRTNLNNNKLGLLDITIILVYILNFLFNIIGDI